MLFVQLLADKELNKPQRELVAISATSSHNQLIIDPIIYLLIITIFLDYGIFIGSIINW